MAVVSQEDFTRIVRMGYTVVDDAGIDLLSIHLPALSVAALGDDVEPFKAAMNEYVTDFAELVERTNFLTSDHRKAAEKHIQWLRGLVALGT